MKKLRLIGDNKASQFMMLFIPKQRATWKLGKCDAPRDVCISRRTASAYSSRACARHSMSALVRFGIPEAVVASNYVAINNPENMYRLWHMCQKMPVQSSPLKE